MVLRFMIVYIMWIVEDVQFIYRHFLTFSDLKYVNNKEYADVTFLVEDREFYAHKIVIVTGKVIVIVTDNVVVNLVIYC